MHGLLQGYFSLIDFHSSPKWHSFPRTPLSYLALLWEYSFIIVNILVPSFTKGATTSQQVSFCPKKDDTPNILPHLWPSEFALEGAASRQNYLHVRYWVFSFWGAGVHYTIWKSWTEINGILNVFLFVSTKRIVDNILQVRKASLDCSGCFTW